MIEPSARRIGEIVADVFHRASTDEPGFLPQRVELRSGNLSARSQRIQFRAPEDFIRHPVADAGEMILHQQQSLERQTAAAHQHIAQDVAGERI